MLERQRPGGHLVPEDATVNRPTTTAGRISVAGVTRPRHDEGAEIDGTVGEIAASLRGRLAELVSDITSMLAEQITDIRQDVLSLELLGASVESNVATVLHALCYQIPLDRVDAPAAALEYARRLAQHGVAPNALVRAYRLGQRRMNELVFAEVGRTDMEPLTRVAVLERISATLFSYIDWVSEQVVGVYEEERERWLENQNTVRAVRVRELLAGKQVVDVDAATASIRYPIRWHHLALVVWYPGTEEGPGADADELSHLHRFVREAGQAAGAAAAPLFIAADRICGWAWLPYRAPAPDAVDKLRQFVQTRAGSPNVAIGPMAPGLGGFRHSHRQAAAARAVAVAAAHPWPTVITASDPGVCSAALLAGDVGEARDWVRDVLGGLAADTEPDARLRETLRVFLGCGSSYKLAADGLHLHFNTVKYRVGRAIARRGRAIGADRLDVELALLVCHWYGAAVLAADPP